MLEAAILVSVALLGCIIFLAFGCSCFRRSQQFKNFDAEAENARESESSVGSEGDNTSLVNFEPLPDILSKAIPVTTALRPRITCIASENNEYTTRIVPVQQAFPRKQLTYISEMGMGWFGQVVQGVADNVLVGVRQSKVVVQVLRDDANALEMQKFLQEVAGYRAMDHPNVLRLHGMCTEAIPFLVLFESCPQGDLKSYLIEHENKMPVLKERKLILHFAVDIACGLACLHRHNYVHCDLSLRNCLVTSDLSVKVGDYGLAEDKFKEDYYDTGCDLLPVRWMAPETLSLQKGVWRTKAFTPKANIWSYGVSMWEMTQFGRQPFHWLTDEQVLDCAILRRAESLPVPSYPANQKTNIYEVMKMCWQEPDQRPTIEELHGHLLDLEITLKTMEESEFEKRWNTMSPVKVESPSHEIEMDSMEIAADALEMFSSENETAQPNVNVVEVPSNIPIEIPIENGMTIPLASHHLLKFNDSDLVTDISTETEEKLLAELESETRNGVNCVAILSFDPELKLKPISPKKSPSKGSDAIKDSSDSSLNSIGRSTGSPVKIKKMQKVSVAANEDGLPSTVPRFSPDISPIKGERASSERVQDLSSIHAVSDESSSDSSAEISEEMADIYFQRNSHPSNIRRSNLKVSSLAPIPENCMSQDNFMDNFDGSYTKNSMEDSLSQDSYEWDEFGDGQLMSKTQENVVSPRRSLDFGDWSMESASYVDYSGKCQPSSIGTTLTSHQSSMPSEISFSGYHNHSLPETRVSKKVTGRNACSIASEILTSRAISPISKKNPPRRTFYTISSVNDLDLDSTDDEIEIGGFETPLSLNSKYSTSHDLTTIGSSWLSMDHSELSSISTSPPSMEQPPPPTVELQPPPPTAELQPPPPSQPPPPQPSSLSLSSSSSLTTYNQEEPFYGDLMERLSSVEPLKEDS